MVPPFDFEETVARLQANLMEPLPGEEAQAIMAPYQRPNKAQALAMNPSPRLSAVMVLVYPKEGIAHTLLTLRSSYKGVHSRQVSFPGGKVEQEDENLEQTALRETKEEVGLAAEHISVLGELTSLYIPPSGFLVQPYVGIVNQTPSFVPDPVEVQQLLETPLELLFDPNRIKTAKIPVMNGQYQIDAPYFDLFDQRVWGATAMMLSEFKKLLQPES